MIIRSLRPYLLELDRLDDFLEILELLLRTVVGLFREGLALELRVLRRDDLGG